MFFFSMIVSLNIEVESLMVGIVWVVMGGRCDFGGEGLKWDEDEVVGFFGVKDLRG